MLHLFFKSSLFIVCLSTNSSWAFAPDRPTCSTRSEIVSAQEIIKTPAANLMWDCMDISNMAKSELIAISTVAPKLALQLSKTNFNRTDFEDLQKMAPVELFVDSKKLGRTDLIELNKAGTRLTINSEDTLFNTIDYTEISAAGPFTLIIHGTQFTLSELSELAKNSKIALIMNGHQSNLTDANYNELLKINSAIKIIP